jgi:hypothetical protein
MEEIMPFDSALHLRLPQDIKEWLAKDAEANDRSMNAQVVAVLRERMNTQQAGSQKQLCC